jgi:hypothetical protein
MTKMIVKPRPQLGCWAVKVKGKVAFKGTEKECLAWVKKAGGEPTVQGAGRVKADGTPMARPVKDAAPKAPKAAKPVKVARAGAGARRAKKTGSVKGALPVIDGITQCPPGVARGGRSPQLGAAVIAA